MLYGEIDRSVSPLGGANERKTRVRAREPANPKVLSLKLLYGYRHSRVQDVNDI